MSKRLVGVAGICLGVFVSLMWQQVGQTAPALTALDYEEIRQLYARYAVAADTNIDDGEMIAQLFTEDGVLNDYRGYEELKAASKSVDRFRVENGIENTPTHYVTNLVIEPTAEGAMGVAYDFGWAVEDALSRGVYHDQLVKTPEGWRFKKRTHTSGHFSDELLQALEQ